MANWQDLQLDVTIKIKSLIGDNSTLLLEMNKKELLDQVSKMKDAGFDFKKTIHHLDGNVTAFGVISSGSGQKYFGLGTKIKEVQNES